MKKEDIEKIAELSKLYIDEEEKEALTEEMNSIVAFADKLNEFNMQEEKYSEYKKGISVQNLREDEEGISYQREELIKNAPETDGKFIIVH